MRSVDCSAKNNISYESFYSRERNTMFHVNLSFHIIDHLGVDNAQDLVTEIFNELHKIVSERRKVTTGCQFYFGNFIRFRRSILYHLFAIERLSMSINSIAIKYGTSYRVVLEGFSYVKSVSL